MEATFIQKYMRTFYFDFKVQRYLDEHLLNLLDPFSLSSPLQLPWLHSCEWWYYLYKVDTSLVLGHFLAHRSVSSLLLVSCIYSKMLPHTDRSSCCIRPLAGTVYCTLCRLWPLLLWLHSLAEFWPESQSPFLPQSRWEAGGYPKHRMVRLWNMAKL